MSGRMPKYSQAPPRASFAPVFTFVENQQRSVPLCQITRRPLQITASSGIQNAMMFIMIGSRIHRGNRHSDFVHEQPLHGAQIIERGHKCCVRRAFQHAGAREITGAGFSGVAELVGFGFHADRNRVVPPVIPHLRS